MDELASIVFELADLYGQYGMALESELRGKVQAMSYAQDSGLNLGATENYVLRANVEMTAQCLRLKWRIRELETLRDHYQFRLEHGL